VSTPDREAVELFLQEASEHLQYLREYVGVLQEVAPRHEGRPQATASLAFPRLPGNWPTFFSTP
jgi:hypothetical protein